MELIYVRLITANSDILLFYHVHCMTTFSRFNAHRLPGSKVTSHKLDSQLRPLAVSEDISCTKQDGQQFSRSS